VHYSGKNRIDAGYVSKTWFLFCKANYFQPALPIPFLPEPVHGLLNPKHVSLF
jgi:hypothetical protein